MALSNTPAGTVPSESGGLLNKRIGNTSLVVVTPSNTNSQKDLQLAASAQRTSFNLDLPQFSQEPKEASTQDFLSLYKSSAVPTRKFETTASQAMTPYSGTQDFLHPSAKPVNGSIISPTLVTSTGVVNYCDLSNINSYGGVQGAKHGPCNGTKELSANVSMWLDGVEGTLNCVKERLDNLAHWSTASVKTGSIYHLEVGQQHKSVLNKVLSGDDEENPECSNRDQRKDAFLAKVEKLDGKNNDCKVSTSRSKHSATEQRRRSKINDRFQMLRQLLPNNDQKRDKASFLLEVIEYIQILQERVLKYEATEHGWQQERLKTVSWDISQSNSGVRVRDSTVDGSCIDPFYGKEHIPIVSTVSFDLKHITDNNILGQPRSTAVGKPGENEVRSSERLLVARTQDGKPIPVSLSTQLPDHPPFGKGSDHVNRSVPQLSECNVTAHLMPSDEQIRLLSDNQVESALPVSCESDPPAQPIKNIKDQRNHEIKGKQPEFCQSDANGEKCHEKLANSEVTLVPVLEPSVGGSSFELVQYGDAAVSEQCAGVDNAIALRPESQQKVDTSTNAQEESMIVQGGIINISSVYSQKLLDALTGALQSSGLDLSQASISVQINLGKSTVTSSSTKGGNQNSEIQLHSQRHGKQPASEDLEHFTKRPKIELEI